MELTLKDNIVYKTFDDKKSLQTEILSLILECKADKILYKGNPDEINYKLMKKVLVGSTKKIDPDEVRSMFKNILEETNNREYCLIKKK